MKCTKKATRGCSTKPAAACAVGRKHMLIERIYGRLKMKLHLSRSGGSQKLLQLVVAITCVALLLPGNTLVMARHQNQQPAADAPKIPADQLDSLVAPIALYPDNL